MWVEIRSDLLWCYYRDRKKFWKTMGGLAVTVAACFLIGLIICLAAVTP